MTSGRRSGGAQIPLEERLVLVAAYCCKTWFAGKAVCVKDLWNDVSEFRAAYRTTNSLGALLGKGVAGHGLELFRCGDVYPATYANGWQLAQRLTEAQLEKVARRLGLDGVGELAAAVRKLNETVA